MSATGETILAIDNWLLTDGVKLEINVLVDAFAHRLCALGLPIHRLGVSFQLLNPSLLAAGLIWRPGEPIEFTRFDWARRDSGMYDNSPFKVAHESGRWVELDLANTPDDRFGVVPDLKAAGLTHYIVVPAPDSGGAVMSITFATRDPVGFTGAQREMIAKLVPSVTAVLEIKRLRATITDVLSAYVGAGPARSIISGTVHRGEVTEVRAAILVADLRGFTHLSTKLPPDATAELINRYYDAVVPAITGHGGEVLKFIGDAVLAIFPTDRVGEDAAVFAALDAARAALNEPVAPFVSGEASFPIRYGIALHVGEAAFGNVGSGDRLDFTVIGRDVNVAARIASLCSRLGRDYLVSEEIAAIGRRHGREMAPAGAHDVRGLEGDVRVFVPDVAAVEPETDDGVSQGLTLAPAP